MQESFTYAITAGDFRSESYRITVVVPPAVQVESVHYDYPDYTGLESRVSPLPDIEALEGTRVSIQARANVPVQTATVDFDPAAAGHMAMTARGQELTSAFTLQRDAQGLPNYNSYRIVFETPEGRNNPRPTFHTIKIRPDLPPEVNIVHPAPEIQAPANAVVPITVVASDPDFSLGGVRLQIQNGQKEPAAIPFDEPLGQRFETTYKLDLAPLRLAPGDVITYWAEARDNKQPIANRHETSKFRIRIGQPVSEEERQKMREEADRQAEKRGEQDKDDEEADPEHPNQARDDGGPDDPTENEDSQENDASPSKPNADESSPSDSHDRSSADRGEREELNNDGSDDAKALEKLVEDMKRNEADKQSAPDRREPEKQDPSKEQNGETKQQTDPQRPQDGQGERKEQATSPNEPEKPENSGTKDEQQKGASQSQPSKPGKQNSPGQSGGAGKQEGEKKGEGPEGANPSAMKAAESGKQPGDPSTDQRKTDAQGEGKDDKPMQQPMDGDAQPAQGNPEGNSEKQKGEPKGSGAQQSKGEPRKDGNPKDGNPSDDPAGAKTSETPKREGDGTPTGKKHAGPAQHEPNPNTEQHKGQEDNPAGTSHSATDGKKAPKPDSDEQLSESETKGSVDAPAQPKSSPGKAKKGKGPAEAVEPDPETGRPRPTRQPKTDNNKPSPPEEAPDEPSTPSGKQDSTTAQREPNVSDTDRPGKGAEGQGIKGDNRGDNQPGRNSASQDGGAPSQEQGKEEDGTRDGKDTVSSTPKDKPGPGSETPGSDKPGGASGDQQQPDEGKGAQPDPQSQRPKQPGGKDQPQPRDPNRKGNSPPPAAADQKPGQQPGAQQGRPQTSGTRSPSPGNPNASGGSPNPGAGNGEQQPANQDAAPGDAPDLEAARKAADLALERVGSQLRRGDVDPDLLKKLGWTEQDLQAFHDRMRRTLDDNKPDDRLNEALNRIRQSFAGAQRTTSDFQRRDDKLIDPGKLKTPPQFQHRANDYRRRISQQGQGETPARPNSK